MSDQPPLSEQGWHHKFAIDLFNDCWKLLGKADRTAAEDDTMINTAHASRYHWGVVGAPSNLAIGEWQLSHVYAVLNRLEPSLYHATRSLQICQENGIGDFSLAYAYEALARAHALAGQADQAARYIELARTAGQQIKEEEDQKLFWNDLATVPGFEG
ncbi:MAG: hypothetical protein WCF84_24610 [Anaerolineae bacterium]